MMPVHVPIEHYAHDVARFASAGARMALYDLVGGAYYRPDRDNTTMVGSMNWSEGARVLDDPDSCPWQANPHVVTRLGHALERHYPGAHAALKSSHAGIYFITPDRYPIVGEPAETPGLFLACAAHVSAQGDTIPLSTIEQ